MEDRKCFLSQDKIETSYLQLISALLIVEIDHIHYYLSMAALFILLTLLIVTSIHSSTKTQTIELIRIRDAKISGKSFGQLFNGLTTNGQYASTIQQTILRQLTVQQFTKTDMFSQNNSFTCNQNFKPNIQQGKIDGIPCNFSSLYYCQPTDTFLHIEQSYMNIFPGSVLMSQYLNGVLDGTESQVPLSEGSNYKNPTIQIYNEASNTTIALNYSNGDINKGISQAIKYNMQNNKDDAIYFEMATSDELFSLAKYMGFNKAFLKKLGLYRYPGSSLTSFKKKIIFIFSKPLGSFSLAIGQKSSPLKTFYSADLPKDTFDSLSSSPVYIDSVTYGSILIFVVDYNEITSNLFSKLDAYKDPGLAQPILNSIISQPSLKVFSRGPLSTQQINTIKSGNWLDYILPVRNKMTNMINPLYYSVSNFNQDRFFATNQFEYVQACN